MMNRRKFLYSTLGISVIATAGALTWTLIPGNNNELSAEFLLKKLELMKSEPIQFASSWSAYKCFIHMAQSVEYSMSGYPVHQSALFKSIVGATAFKVFSSKSAMSHDLEEEIPGAPTIPLEGNEISAIERLQQALIDFQNYYGDFVEHFAFGPLNKAEYERAHVMHAYNHFTQLI